MQLLVPHFMEPFVRITTGLRVALAETRYAIRSSVLLLLFCQVAPVTVVHAQWGATPPESTARPNTDWVHHFNAKADVTATGDIDTAIDRCDGTVGTGHYCSVEVSADIIGQPFSVNRSRTRVFATSTGKPVVAVPGRPTVLIGSNTQQVLIENLRLAGVRSGYQPVFGIMVSGSSIHDIVLRNNRIYQFDSDSSAHGIIVLGSGASNQQRISNITITDNRLSDMKTGASESIAINGNVTNWVVSGNRLDNINNIAIDAIGGEGTVAPVTIAGRVVPNPLDAARIGWIENNVVNNMSTLNNPAYGRKRSWAGAIYVDGGRRITISGNKVSNAAWAYDIGAENCVTTEHITLRNNSAVNSYYGDLRVGGYAPTGYLADQDTIDCDPHSTEDINEGHGYVRRLTVANNQFRSVNTTQQNILVEYRTTESIIAEPGVDPVNAKQKDRSRRLSGDSNAYRVTE